MEPSKKILAIILAAGNSERFNDNKLFFEIDGKPVLQRTIENILSVDVPSGFLSQSSVEPRNTITFHDLKEGMNEENCGEIVIRDVGIPKEIELKTGPGELLLYPKWNPKKHKGQNGKVAVLSLIHI